MITLSDACIVFDLDDTLYNEADYRDSGFRSVIELCLVLFDIDVSQVIRQAENNDQDVLLSVCNYLSLPDSVKDSLIWHYRLHYPSISLNNDIKKLIEFVKDNAKHVAIITDGREVTQKQKLLALGLNDIPALISESWGETKPGYKRFEHVMKSMPAKQYVYIGDNIKKDFITPNNLGWETIGIIDQGINIHSQKVYVTKDFMPKVWLKNITCMYSSFK